MNRTLALVLSTSLLTSAGCIHAQNPTPARVAGGAMLAVGALTVATPDSCDDGNSLEEFGCAVEQSQFLLLGAALATIGVILLFTQGPETEDHVASTPPPRSFYSNTAPHLAASMDGSATAVDVPLVPLLAAPGAKPTAVQMARTAWIAASLGRCDTVIRATALIASADPDYYELAVATNPTISTCLTP